MPDPSPTTLAACDEYLPLLPIMRQFDFGQFVFLHEQPHPTASAHEAPRAPKQIVFDPSGGMQGAREEWFERYQIDVLKNPKAPRPPRVPHVGTLGGVSLESVFTKQPRPRTAPVEIPVAAGAIADVVAAAEIVHGGEKYTLDLDDAAVAALTSGREALVMASSTSGGVTQRFMTQLKPNVPELKLNKDDVNGILALGQFRSNGTIEYVELDAGVANALLNGESVVARTNGGSHSLVRLTPPASAPKPAAATMVVGDLADFLVEPQIPGMDGRPIALKLKAGEVQQLRAAGAATIVVGGTQVTLYEGNDQGGERASSSYRATANVNPRNTAGRVITEPLKAPTEFVESAAVSAWPVGLPVAVFMPWRQTWTLLGFSRGELRSSIALAPQEETTIEVSSWERRLRTLDQSSETDIDQSFETSATTRETDDVFQELTKHHDFNWQIQGSMDASYSTGMGSISVSLGGEVSDASQLQSIARNTHQGMKESTQKAAAKIRSVRTTHITDSIEGGAQTRVTRQIKNANFSHTLTLDFFETLAHYRVTLAAVPERLTLVALLPNPMAITKFDREVIRRNETALRRALLEPALVDGFAACRKTRAYEEAGRLIKEQAHMGAETDASSHKTSGVPPPPPLATPSPQELAVVDVLRHIAGAYAVVQKDADCVPALKHVQKGDDLPTAEMANAQHWLFLRLSNKYLPGLIGGIAKVPLAPTIADAGPLVAQIPAPAAPTRLSNLNEKSAAEKELTGLGFKIRDICDDFNWSATSTRAGVYGLYTADDGGLAGLIDQLQRVYQAYLAKQAEGDLKIDKDVAIANATAQQDKLSTADKLGMAFPLDELAAAREREEALIKHVQDHSYHYAFALFQGLSPAEQSAYIEQASGGALAVGMFEPRVIAINGPQLAVPLTAPPEGDLRTFLESLRKSFATAFGGTADNPDEFIFPTPGLTINSRLGTCSASESFIVDSRAIELRRLTAEAESAEHEAARRAARIAAKELGDPVVENAPLHVTVDRPA